MSLFAQKQVETKIDVKKNKIGAQFNLTYKKGEKKDRLEMWQIILCQMFQKK